MTSPPRDGSPPHGRPTVTRSARRPTLRRLVQVSPRSPRSMARTACSIVGLGFAPVSRSHRRCGAPVDERSQIAPSFSRAPSDRALTRAAGEPCRPTHGPREWIDAVRRRRVVPRLRRVGDGPRGSSPGARQAAFERSRRHAPRPTRAPRVLLGRDRLAQRPHRLKPLRGLRPSLQQQLRRNRPRRRRHRLPRGHRRDGRPARRRRSD